MNEQLTILKEQARLSIFGESYPDTPTNSGDGEDLTQHIIDILDEFPDITLPPDIDPEDWDDIPIVIGVDPDTGLPELIYEDPDTGELVVWSLDDLDWEDFIDNLDIDPADLLNLDLTGPLDGLNLDVWVNDNFEIQMEDMPASINVVFPPNKTEYSVGQVISIAGMYVYAYDAEGHVWRGSGKTGDRYRTGRIPNEELMIDPKVAPSRDDPIEAFGGMVSSGGDDPNNTQGAEVNTIKFSRSGIHYMGIMNPSGTMYVIAVSDSPFSYTYKGITNGRQTDRGSGSSSKTTWCGQNVYMVTMGVWYYPLPTPSIPTIGGDGTSSGARTAALTAFYGPDSEDQRSVNVIWNYKTVQLTSRFSITLKSGGGGR